MVAQHTPFEYDPTDNGIRRVERARLSFKPSEQLRDTLLEFVLPSQRERVLGRGGLFLYSNYSWDVYRKPNGILEPQDALMESDFRKIQMMNDRKMKLSQFVVCKEVRPRQLNNRPTTVVGLKVSMEERQAAAMYKNPRVPSELLSQYTVPVHVAFPEDIAVPAVYQGGVRSQLERFVFGRPISAEEAIGAGESPNVHANVTDMQLIFKQRS